MLANQGRKAVFNLCSKTHDDCYNCETLLSLFDTYVSSILNYSCEVWGNHRSDDIEKVHLYFLKRILKVKKTAVNNMVYCELGRYPMFIERNKRIIKYWFKVLTTDNCILKACYEDMLDSSFKKPNDKTNWSCLVKEILFKYGFHEVWYNQSVINMDVFIMNFTQRMKDTFLTEVNAFFNDSSKCALYKYIYESNMLQFY